ncbi:MAG TPA: hypothetical protein VHK01_08540 [Lacipirellulaceae bacterium]|jgi:hypothetical protein|nr:hypothetical protein [Lacipirellulaceae bacterium]
MPARQDQTLQIFLIVCIFLVLVLGVATYLGWKGYSDTDQRLTAANTSLGEKNTQVSNMQTENENLREFIGFERNDNFPDVEAQFKQDMNTYGPGVSEGSRYYRKVLEAVFTELQRTAANETELKKQVEDLNNKMEAVQGEKEQQVAQYQQAAQKADQDRAAETNKFTQDRATLEQKQQELLAIVDKQKTDFEANVAKLTADQKQYTDRIAELELAVKNLTERLKPEIDSFEVADGRISSVNQDGTVWINLGSADSLRRQVTFSVFDGDRHEAEKATKKASIEVTRILGDHMAEARVTSDEPTNPILAGDLIYSQIWQRGRKLRFALAGIIDIDNDGQSDMQLARELIELNGGIVDMYVKEDGTTEGQITANTKYLVLGEYPNLATQVDLQKPWEDMHRTAQSLGVETITMTDFLNQMGYRPQDRTVQLGAGASARDFPAQPENGSTRSGATRFRPRTPTRTQPSATE